jgi:hypothetical protein
MANRTKLTPKKRREFLTALSESCNVTASAHAAGLSRQRLYELRRENPDFAVEWDNAVDEAVDKLELEARRRALQGVRKPIYYRGSKVGSTQEYSDLLTIFLLKAHRPEKYRERVSAELTGPAGAPLDNSNTLVLARQIGWLFKQIEAEMERSMIDVTPDPDLGKNSN